MSNNKFLLKSEKKDVHLDVFFFPYRRRENMQQHSEFSFHPTKQNFLLSFIFDLKALTARVFDPTTLSKRSASLATTYVPEGSQIISLGANLNLPHNVLEQRVHMSLSLRRHANLLHKVTRFFCKIRILWNYHVLGPILLLKMIFKIPYFNSHLCLVEVRF